MSAYALVENGGRETIDVFLRREDAFAALADAISDWMEAYHRATVASPTTLLPSGTPPLRACRGG